VQSAKLVSVESVEKVLPEFRGEIWQTPPMYSAKKVEGKKLYELARKGIEIERKPVKVSIYNLEILKGTQHSALSTQHFAFRVSCSAGTYIRTLAEDIGKKLEVGAHLAELRRTRAGRFDLSKAVTLEELEKIALENRLGEISISMNEAVSHLPQVSLSEDEITKARNGQKLKKENFDANDGENIRMIDKGENLLAVGVYNEAEKTIQPKIVLM
jgi:tRNA pseudouridine55 synthase